MTRTVKTILTLAGLALTATVAGAAYAQATGDQATPQGWNYEIKDGARPGELPARRNRRNSRRGTIRAAAPRRRGCVRCGS